MKGGGERIGKEGTREKDSRRRINGRGEKIAERGEDGGEGKATFLLYTDGLVTF